MPVKHPKAANTCQMNILKPVYIKIYIYVFCILQLQCFSICVVNQLTSKRCQRKHHTALAPTGKIFRVLRVKKRLSQETRSILHGYFNPLVFWYQWEYPLTSKEFVIFCRVSKIGNVNGEPLGTQFIAQHFRFEKFYNLPRYTGVS